MELVDIEKIWFEAVAGSQEAWRDLYNNIGRIVYNFFLKNTYNSNLAKDLTQMLFEKLYLNKDKFKQKGELKKWVFKIAKNLLIDELRKNSSQCNQQIISFHENANYSNNCQITEFNLEDSVINKIDREKLINALDQCLLELKFDERIVICLVYLAGLKISELSEVLEIPIGTAKTKVRQARLKLQVLLNTKLKENENKNYALTNYL